MQNILNAISVKLIYETWYRCHMTDTNYLINIEMLNSSEATYFDFCYFSLTEILLDPLFLIRIYLRTSIRCILYNRVTLLNNSNSNINIQVCWAEEIRRKNNPLQNLALYKRLLNSSHTPEDESQKISTMLGNTDQLNKYSEYFPKDYNCPYIELSNWYLVYQ